MLSAPNGIAPSDRSRSCRKNDHPNNLDVAGNDVPLQDVYYSVILKSRVRPIGLIRRSSDTPPGSSPATLPVPPAVSAGDAAGGFGGGLENLGRHGALSVSEVIFGD